MSGFNNYNLSISLEDNIKIIKEIFKNDDTLIFRLFENQYDNRYKCCIIFADGMVNNSIINDTIILPIVENTRLKKKSDTSDAIDELQYRVILANNVIKSKDLNQLIDGITNGSTILFLEGTDKFLIISTVGWETRTIEEPPSERIIKGPRDGFIESIMENLSMLRRSIKSPDLKFRFMTLGEKTRTKACVCYVEGIANEKLVDELFKRLDSFNMDGTLTINNIQETIKDHPLSPFKTTGNTERPDVVAAKLMEGRIALFLDGTPVVMTIPFMFIESFQANEDYYTNFYYGSINRMLRILGFLITTSIPALYLAFATFHQELIPTPLVLSISAARQDIPFPTIVELMAMLVVFEILREAGTRMPTYIGQALSIVGALVLGQAAVQARIVSAPVIIVVGLSGVTGLMIPSIAGVSIICRILLLLLASGLGIHGYNIGVLFLLVHLFSLQSFGVPYMSNINSFKLQELKDTAIRTPWWYMKYRPRSISPKNPKRKPIGENDNE